MNTDLPYYLDGIDRRILKSLKKGPAYPSDLAKRLDLPRTTIAYRLKQLAKFKAATMRIEGRKSVWKISYPPASLAPKKIATYDGDRVIDAYSLLFKLPPGSTIWSIQGAKAAQGELAALPASFIKEAHRIFKRRRYAMKGVSNIAAAKHLERAGMDLLKSHIGRTVGVKMFTNELFTESGEIFVTDKFLLLVDPTAKAAVSCSDPGIVAIARDVCSLLYDLLENMRSFDINRYLEGIVTE